MLTVFPPSPATTVSVPAPVVIVFVLSPAITLLSPVAVDMSTVLVVSGFSGNTISLSSLPSTSMFWFTFENCLTSNSLAESLFSHNLTLSSTAGSPVSAFK